MYIFVYLKTSCLAVKMIDMKTKISSLVWQRCFFNSLHQVRSKSKIGKPNNSKFWEQENQSG
jgi:hypothetical protein